MARAGDAAHQSSDAGAARTHSEDALELFAAIPDPYSTGWTHVRLALMSGEQGKSRHLDAARGAWLSIGRDDLVEQHL